MILTTSEVQQRYNLPPSTFATKKKILIDEGALYAKGSSGSDPWLWRSSVITKLALSGALGNKARQAAANHHIDNAEEEHY